MAQEPAPAAAATELSPAPEEKLIVASPEGQASLAPEGREAPKEEKSTEEPKEEVKPSASAEASASVETTAGQAGVAKEVKPV